MSLKPTLLHSHNDYWCKRPLWDAIDYGCNMIEADIIYLNKKLMLSHSWRPFTWMCYGELEKTYLKPLSQYCQQNPDKEMWMYVEYKDSDENINDLLYHLFKNYSIANLHYTISAQNEKWYQKGRYKTAMKFYNMYKEELQLKWKTTELAQEYEIKKVDLFPDSIWHF
ncbi:MAG: hypothetical protein N3F66_00935 [Spirochaetes bacterium]|nr:hypothetical protein [Spirochaetota bacterium]